MSAWWLWQVQVKKFLGRSAEQHRVAVAEEAVALLNGVAVQRHHMAMSGKRTNEHHER